MEDLGHELHHRWLVRVVIAELQRQFERSAIPVSHGRGRQVGQTTSDVIISAHCTHAEAQVCMDMTTPNTPHLLHGKWEA
jgi:hypothetical protein